MVEEWRSFKDIISLFCEASSLEASTEKSRFIYANVDEYLRPFIDELFNYKMVDFTVGFKYLGFILKNT